MEERGKWTSLVKLEDREDVQEEDEVQVDTERKGRPLGELVAPATLVSMGWSGVRSCGCVLICREVAADAASRLRLTMSMASRSCLPEPRVRDEWRPPGRARQATSSWNLGAACRQRAVSA